MKALTLISLFALPLAQAAPCIDVRRMIDAGDFPPHFPSVSDIKRQFPSAKAFDCGGDNCYSVRVGPGKWFVFHVTSEGGAESAEISEIAELGFPPTRALADQETHVDTARMDLAGMRLGEPVASLQDMRKGTAADTKSMVGCEFDIYERSVGATDTNLRYSVCLRKGVIAGLAFSDPE